MSAEEFMAEVTMAMLHVHKIETRIAGHSCGVMEILDEFTNVAVGEQRIVFGQAKSLVEQGMVVQDSRPKVTVSSGMCELKTDEQAIIASAFPPMFSDQCLAQIFDIAHCPFADQKLIRI